ncbi:two-component system, chemotaxis family, sensor kinase CheA [Halorubrum aquaticum]|uniref:Chemotaxis protein CheA n=1 Tax=Halorubrum aquaticum TaxID=387340 RepID=A0A1I3ATI4_9EURY|nr:chemotaxis protein CheA [Halorubrum aquaticum]SFH53106.1 two-component system, chemotaxis family, sensor kinase CheA [Halorubrum aquaticum]
MDSHRAAFVAEAEDGITDLNNALLALEADPGDDAAMDDVFRVAHTLKGNAAAMGYEDVSSFGHALEDLLDAVRGGEREVTPELMDLLFEGVDTVEAMVAEIEETGEVSTDPSDLESRLRAVEEHGTVDPGADGDDDENVDAGAADVEIDDGADAPENGDDEDAAGNDGSEDDGGESDDVDAGVDVPEPPAAAAGFEDAVYAEVTVGETAMPGVDAALVLQALEENFEEYATRPDAEALEEGEYEEAFDAFVADAEPAVVAEGLEALTQVTAVRTALVADGLGADPDGGSGADATAADATGVDADATAAIDVEDVDGGAEPDDGDDADSEADGSTDREEIKSIRVDVDQVDELYGLVEQLVTSRIKLRRELEGTGTEPDTLDELDKLASSLQDTAMDMRLIPFSQVSDSFPRLVRDIARDLDKRVKFDIEGDDVELDRTILTEMRDPLVHVLRNAVDHGIEPPEEREAAGKEPVGSVELTAERERDHVVIEVADDGAGLDADRLRDKAVEEGVEDRETVEAMTDGEAYDLVFHPGFSTAEEVTDVSGRGVGMDVVRTTARDLDGSVSVDSEPGEGTTVRFRLPVTVAIVKVMFVDVGGTEYGIPIKSIAEVSRADDVETVHGDEVVRHEDDLYSVIRLEERLAAADEDGTAGTGDGTADPGDGTAGPTDAAATDGGAVEAGAETGTTGNDVPAASAAGTAAGEGMLVRIREETRKVALHCDGVLDQEEVVVKPLDGPLSGTPGLSGTAVLGDGDVVAVLDVVSL